MRKKLFLFSLAITLCFNSAVIAHPGRTDANGGHYVRTEGWGEPVGSYHYHNGENSSSSQRSSSSDAAANDEDIYDDDDDDDEADNSENAESRKDTEDYDSGYHDGLKDGKRCGHITSFFNGYSDGFYDYPLHRFDDGDITNGTSYYERGYYDGFYEGVLGVGGKKYCVGYRQGYDDAQSEKPYRPILIFLYFFLALSAPYKVLIILLAGVILFIVSRFIHKLIT